MNERASQRTPSTASQVSEPIRAGTESITVSVTFVAGLRRFLPRGADGPQRYALPPGARTAHLLTAIGIEPDADLTIAVDGELADRETPLRDGAEVMLLSPMEGGSSAPNARTGTAAGGARQGPRSPSRARQFWCIKRATASDDPGSTNFNQPEDSTTWLS